jgi:hypothetical protein
MARKRATSSSDRSSRLLKALASKEPLTALEPLVDDSTPAGKTFRWAFACILETNSAGLPILFDRFEDEELDRVQAALGAIEAKQTLADIRRLRQAFEKATGKGMDRLEASDAIANDPKLKPIARAHAAQVEEMERQLIAFSKAHVRDL